MNLCIALYSIFPLNASMKMIPFCILCLVLFFNPTLAKDCGLETNSSLREMIKSCGVRKFDRWVLIKQKGKQKLWLDTKTWKLWTSASKEKKPFFEAFESCAETSFLDGSPALSNVIMGLPQHTEFKKVNNGRFPVVFKEDDFSQKQMEWTRTPSKKIKGYGVTVLNNDKNNKLLFSGGFKDWSLRFRCTSLRPLQKIDLSKVKFYNIYERAKRYIENASYRANAFYYADLFTLRIKDVDEVLDLYRFLAEKWDIKDKQKYRLEFSRQFLISVRRFIQKMNLEQVYRATYYFYSWEDGANFRDKYLKLKRNINATDLHNLFKAFRFNKENDFLGLKTYVKDRSHYLRKKKVEWILKYIKRSEKKKICYFRNFQEFEKSLTSTLDYDHSLIIRKHAMCLVKDFNGLTKVTNIHIEGNINNNEYVENIIKIFEDNYEHFHKSIDYKNIKLVDRVFNTINQCIRFRQKYVFKAKNESELREMSKHGNDNPSKEFLRRLKLFFTSNLKHVI